MVKSNSIGYKRNISKETAIPKQGQDEVHHSEKDMIIKDITALFKDANDCNLFYTHFTKHPNLLRLLVAFVFFIKQIIAPEF